MIGISILFNAYYKHPWFRLVSRSIRQHPDQLRQQVQGPDSDSQSSPGVVLEKAGHRTARMSQDVSRERFGDMQLCNAAVQCSLITCTAEGYWKDPKCGWRNERRCYQGLHWKGAQSLLIWWTCLPLWKVDKAVARLKEVGDVWSACWLWSAGLHSAPVWGT